jgi:hypothetical protein
MLRTLDAEDFNRIANDPIVSPWLGYADPTAPIDLSKTVSNPANFCFMTAERDGGYILIRQAAGLFMAHSLALPDARGRRMAKLMHDGFDMMFTATDCVEVTTAVPDGNDAAASWSDRAGFKNTFRREASFKLMGEMVGVQYKSLTYQDWVPRSGTARIVGKAFHDRLDAVAGGPSHPQDLVHESWVGATMSCAVALNLQKGVDLYNRYAITAGYLPVKIIGHTPPVVDIGTAVVQLWGGAMDVLAVRRASPPTM